MTADRRERAISAGAVILLHAGLLWLLLHARAPAPVPVSPPVLTTFDVVPPPVRPPIVARQPRPERQAGSSGRAVVRAERSAVVAPVPIVVLPVAIPAPVMPQAGVAILGGAIDAGRGNGAGRSGDGAGSGVAGSGTGGGGGTRARLIAGSIDPRDYPKGERAARIGGTVTVAFIVDADGRAHGCEVVTSSGNDALDTTTCRLVEARFRYSPARNANGQPVSERRGWRQRWWIDDTDR